ncbi:MAG: hypothetical protein WC429_17395, partial [Verrucomicrobiia bacterium]
MHYPSHRSIELAQTLSSCRLRRRTHRRPCAVLLLAVLLGVSFSGSARAQLGSSGGAETFAVSAGGMLFAGNIVSNGLPFTIGDGTNAATLNLPSGTNTFANGLMVAA